MLCLLVFGEVRRDGLKTTIDVHLLAFGQLSGGVALNTATSMCFIVFDSFNRPFESAVAPEQQTFCNGHVGRCKPIRASSVTPNHVYISLTSYGPQNKLPFTPSRCIFTVKVTFTQ